MHLYFDYMFATCAERHPPFHCYYKFSHMYGRRTTISQTLSPSLFLPHSSFSHSLYLLHPSLSLPPAKAVCKGAGACSGAEEEPAAGERRGEVQELPGVLHLCQTAGEEEMLGGEWSHSQIPFLCSGCVVVSFIYSWLYNDVI